MPTRTSQPALVALVTGAATVGYYASPDLVTSRRMRAVTKAGMAAVIVAAALPEELAGREAARADQLTGDAPDISDSFASLPARAQAVVVGGGVALLGVTVGATVAAERWAYRRGEQRAAAGQRLPHTRAALVYGALAAALTLVPVPSGPQEPDREPAAPARNVRPSRRSG